MSKEKSSVVRNRSDVVRHRGVWADVYDFLSRLPVRTEVVWVTFNLGPSQEQLDAFDEFGLPLRIICQHPQEGEGAGPSIRPTIYDRVAKMHFDLRGFLQDHATQDETLQIGPLHAKWIVTRQGDDYRVVHGSFNFSATSLNSNCETFVEGSGRSAETIWTFTERLWTLSAPISREDCEQPLKASKSKRMGRPPGDVEGGPKDVGARPRNRELSELPPIQSPVDVAALALELQRRMSSWPSEGKKQQWEIACDLEEELADLVDGPWQLLYLPVGVGKTLIALHWLARRIGELQTSEQDQSWVLYATPNEWVARSVREHLMSVAKAAGIDYMPDQFVIARPAEAWRYVEGRARPIAAVVDECHNWSDGNRSVTGSYSSLVDRLGEEGIPLLGLSATPCRYEHGLFAPKDFVGRWLAREPGDNAKPRMTVASAVEEGFLCPFEYCADIAVDAQDEVRSLLYYDDDGRRVGFGDYSSVTLRNVWDAIASDACALAQDVTDAIKKKSARRIVVFLPPVEQDADAFVDELDGSIRRFGGALYDFRSAATSNSTKVFDEFCSSSPTQGNPSVLVTVDRFREGVNVPDIDMLVMLRATLSPVVAMQALGRGLRTHPSKTKCTILDAVLFRERVALWEEGLSATKGSPLHSASVQGGDEKCVPGHAEKLFTEWLINYLGEDDRATLANWLGAEGGKRSRTSTLAKLVTAKEIVADESPVPLSSWQHILGYDDLQTRSYGDALRHLFWCYLSDDVSLAGCERVIDLRRSPETVDRLAELLGVDESRIRNFAETTNGATALRRALERARLLRVPSR